MQNRLIYANTPLWIMIKQIGISFLGISGTDTRITLLALLMLISATGDSEVVIAHVSNGNHYNFQVSQIYQVCIGHDDNH